MGLNEFCLSGKTQLRWKPGNLNPQDVSIKIENYRKTWFWYFKWIKKNDLKAMTGGNDRLPSILIFILTSICMGCIMLNAQSLVWFALLDNGMI